MWFLSAIELLKGTLDKDFFYDYVIALLWCNIINSMQTTLMPHKN